MKWAKTPAHKLLYQQKLGKSVDKYFKNMNSKFLVLFQEKMKK